MAEPTTRRSRSVSFGLTMIAAGIVAISLTAGALGLLMILRASLDQGITDTALLRATDVASLAQSGSLPASLAFPGEERSVIQVINAAGVVVASTGNLTGEPPLATAGPKRAYTVTSLPVGEQQRYRLTVTSAAGPSGPLTIVAGESLDRVDVTLSIVRRTLFAGLPVLIGLVAALAWFSTRRALRPVEQIRAEVAEISATDLHRRVVQPPPGNEISLLASTMNQMLERLERSSQRQARFVADASHELRSPLASLRAQLEIGLARPDRTDWPNRVTGALADATRLETLIHDLLLLSRLDAAQPQRLERCDLANIAQEALDRCDIPDGIQSALRADGSGEMEGDPEQLGRALSNLLDNAARHADTKIELSVRRLEDRFIIDVSNDGANIDAADRQTVFERFVRLDEARSSDYGGSGLGLAIVREIVEAHGGAIEVVDSDTGTCMRIVLPARQRVH
jgi:signal transduction histidine kinase